MKGPTKRGSRGALSEGVRASIEALLTKQRELERLATHFETGVERVDRVALEIAKADGKPVKRDDVTQTLFKLRRAFRAAEQNWFLIQTDRRGSVRFALRAGATRSVIPAMGRVDENAE